MPGEDANFTKPLTGELESTGHLESVSIDRIRV
jgi:hypothetical protein